MNIELITARCEAAITNMYGNDGFKHKITNKPFEIDDGLTWCWQITGVDNSGIVVNEPSRDTTLKFNHLTGAIKPYQWGAL